MAFKDRYLEVRSRFYWDWGFSSIWWNGKLQFRGSDEWHRHTIAVPILPLGVLITAYQECPREGGECAELAGFVCDVCGRPSHWIVSGKSRCFVHNDYDMETWCDRHDCDLQDPDHNYTPGCTRSLRDRTSHEEPAYKE